MILRGQEAIAAAGDPAYEGWGLWVFSNETRLTILSGGGYPPKAFLVGANTVRLASSNVVSKLSIQAGDMGNELIRIPGWEVECQEVFLIEVPNKGRRREFDWKKLIPVWHR